MLELARDDREQPYRGCASMWRAAVRQERLALEHEQAVADVPIRFEGLPGEYLQVDWGEIRHFPFTHQPSGRRYFLACRLKYSRWVWVRFTTDMRQETLFRGLVDCFCALGFVPWVLVFDNMKTVTIGRDDQEQPIWHRSLLQLAAEFDFHPVACWPESGNIGRQERMAAEQVQGRALARRQVQCLHPGHHLAPGDRPRRARPGRTLPLGTERRERGRRRQYTAVRTERCHGAGVHREWSSRPVCRCRG